MVLMGNPHGNPQGEPMGNPHGYRNSQWQSLGMTGGRAELSHGRFLLDLGIFAWVEQALDTAENCSTPCPRPGIRPRRFCLSRIPGLRPGVEQGWGGLGSSRFWPGWGASSTHAETPGSRFRQILKFWPAEVGHKPTTHTCTIWHCGPRMV